VVVDRMLRLCNGNIASTDIFDLVYDEKRPYFPDLIRREIILSFEEKRSLTSY